MKALNLSRLSFLIALILGLVVAWCIYTPSVHATDLDKVRGSEGTACSICSALYPCIGWPGTCFGVGVATGCLTVDPNCTCYAGGGACQGACTTSLMYCDQDCD